VYGIVGARSAAAIGEATAPEATALEADGTASSSSGCGGAVSVIAVPIVGIPVARAWSVQAPGARSAGIVAVVSKWPLGASSTVRIRTSGDPSATITSSIGPVDDRSPRTVRTPARPRPEWVGEQAVLAAVGGDRRGNDDRRRKRGGDRQQSAEAPWSSGHGTTTGQPRPVQADRPTMAGLRGEFAAT
jgi:hypothetical protein